MFNWNKTLLMAGVLMIFGGSMLIGFQIGMDENHKTQTTRQFKEIIVHQSITPKYYIDNRTNICFAYHNTSMSTVPCSPKVTHLLELD